MLHRCCELGAGAQAIQIRQRAGRLWECFRQASGLHNVRDTVLPCSELPTAQSERSSSAWKILGPWASALGRWAQINAAMTRRSFIMSPAFRTADGRTFESWKRKPRVVGRCGSQVVLKGKAIAACATISGMRPEIGPGDFSVDSSYSPSSPSC